MLLLEDQLVTFFHVNNKKIFVNINKFYDHQPNNVNWNEIKVLPYQVNVYVVLDKMFELHIQAFHSYKGILSIRPSDPEEDF